MKRNRSDAGPTMVGGNTETRVMEYGAPPTVRRSALGIASFIVALATIAALAAIFAVISGRAASDPLAYKLLGAALILPVSGTVLGVASLCQRRRYRGLAIAGVIVNVALSAFVLLAIVPALLLK